MALNAVWVAFFAAAFATACARAAGGDVAVFARLSAAFFDAARSGFEIALGLTGMMALWLGLLRVGERAGLVDALARLARPLLRTLLPGVPAGHPAEGAMAMNVSANLLGLDNAATPLGLKAMRELQTLNPHPGTATNAQVLFMVLNTAGLTLLPTSVIALRQAVALRQGVAGFNAADILVPTVLATACSCLAGLAAVAWCQRLPLLRPRVWLPLLAVAVVGAGAGVGALLLRTAPTAQMAQAAQVAQALDGAGALGALGAFAVVALATGFVLAGAWRRLPVYEIFVEGAKEGFGVAVQIVPYLVGMLCAIALFRAAGCLDWLLALVGRGAAAAGLDTDFLPALPVGVMKVFSGAGARALMVDVMQTHGVASFPARLAAIIQGSTETTFYVLAVYAGSVGLTNLRHALACALLADAVGLVAAIGIGYAFFH